MNASDRQHQHDANPPDGVLQLRVVVEVDDFDAALGGRSRDVDDLQPAPASDPITHVEDRRAGTAMSADDIVDYVLDALRLAEPAAAPHP
jgi:hypothetical protein